MKGQARLLRLTRLDSPSSLREQALQAIRVGIVTGSIEEGRIYSAPAIAQALGVSATPVREAMLELANEGLMEALRNRGFRVIPLTDRSLNEIFELRILLEVPSVGRLAGRLSSADAARFRALIDEMRAQEASGDLHGFLECDRRFHLGLLELSGNRRLVELVGRLRDQTRLYGLADLMATGILAASHQEHSEILDALTDGDKSAAEAAMRRHISHTRGIWAGLREPEPLRGTEA